MVGNNGLKCWEQHGIFARFVRTVHSKEGVQGIGQLVTIGGNVLQRSSGYLFPGGSMSVEIPGYIAGTWAIDPVHSEVSFVVRHMMVSKVRGRFDKFDATIVTADDPLQSSVTAKVDLTSINTGQEQRDAHIRSADFFEVEKYPAMTFTSTARLSASGTMSMIGSPAVITPPTV